MIGEVFAYILTASVYASIAGLIILLIKALLKDRLSASWHCLIWAVLIIKLVFPFGPASSVSLFNQIPVEQAQSRINDFKYPNQEHLTTPVIHDTASSGRSGSLAPAAPSLADTAQDIVPYVWLAVTVLFVVFLFFINLLLYLRLRRSGRKPDQRISWLLAECRQKMGVCRDIPIVIQNTVKAPSLLGSLYPRILLAPSAENLSDQEIKYILLHELAHYKRKDVPVYYLLLVLQAINWFNPVLWYCFKRMRQDMELAADEMVLNRLEAAEFKAYGRAILAVLDNMGRGVVLPRLVGMVNGRDDIERRIQMVSRAHLLIKNRRFLFTAGLICLLALAPLILTSSKAVSVVRAHDFTYTNKQYGFSLIFPAKWQDQYIIKEAGDTISVYNKELAFTSPKRNMGRLFTINAFSRPKIYLPSNEWETDGNTLGQTVTHKVIGESDRAVFTVTYPSDVQFTPDKAADYSSMEKDVPAIIKSFKTDKKPLSPKAQYEQNLKRQEMDSETMKGLILNRQTKSKAELGTGKLAWPLAGPHYISADYGMRYHPVLKKKSMHIGIDMPTANGVPVLAADGGKVIYVGTVGSYGRVVVIDHGKGLSTLYTQLSSADVLKSKNVTKGSQIGKVGSTGYSTGPHLHFEVRKNGVPVDPHDYV